MVPKVITFTKFTACNTLVRAVGGSNKDDQEIVSRPTQNSLAGLVQPKIQQNCGCCDLEESRIVF
jgi:hypothetical protein